MYTVTSRFITLPTKKLVNVKEDFTDNENGIKDLDATLYSVAPDEVQGADIKVVLKAYQDEAATIDRQKIVEFYKAAGAESVDINIIRVPRGNIRSTNLRNMVTLRDKLIERERLNGNPDLPETILQKADQLETETPEAILAGLLAL